MKKKILQRILKILAKKVLKKYNPKVVGITGSVGKTSAKEAIYTVLSSKFKVRENIKNYNNEIGLPLTILGFRSANKSIFGWIKVFLKAISIILIKDVDFPEVIILEMGIDKPGDMDYLNSIVKLDVAVLTLIGSSHLEFFGSVENIKKEKIKIFNSLKKDGQAIVNFDDPNSKNIKDKLNNMVVSFGFDKEADVSAQNIILSFKNPESINSLAGIHFKIKHNGSHVPVLLPKVISYSSIYASLAAIVVGFSFKLNGIEISKSLLNFSSPKGRMNLVDGINNTMIIDDTYNASPQSVLAALDIVEQIKLIEMRTKWVVLGDMLELGADSEKEHLIIGKKIADIAKIKLAVVGEKAKNFGKGAESNGMKKVHYFNNNNEVSTFLKNNIHDNDLVLVKGSQGARMENVVKQIMLHEKQAEDLLVRQDNEWK